MKGTTMTTTEVHNATGGNHDAPSTAPAPNVNEAAPQHPVGRTPQNDFREQRVSEAQEHATWEKSTSDRTPPRPMTAGLQPGSDLSAFTTVTATTGLALDGTHAISDPVRLLADDPTRVSALLTSFATAQCYLAHSPADFQGFASRVASAGLNAIPMPGMVFVENNLVVLNTSREVWIMFIANAGVQAWASVIIDRGGRSRP